MGETERDNIENPYLESPKKFHLEMPLYHEFNLSQVEIARKIYQHLSYKDTIDAYCTTCGRESVFIPTVRIKATGDIFRGKSECDDWMANHNGFEKVVYKCIRGDSHQYHIYYLKNGEDFMKIGQWPSVADLQIPQAEKYRKVLGEDQYKELTKGIGIAAHGVGIGAFVYLRRIFEKLIEEAHKKAVLKDTSFDDKKYIQERMAEKIKMLKQYLPEFLVQNSALYGILSKAIHELTENACIEYFNVAKTGIELILDEKIAQEEKERKLVVASKAIQQAQSIIAGSQK